MGVLCRTLAVTLLIVCVNAAVKNRTLKTDIDNFIANDDYDNSEERSEILFSEEKPCPRDCICTVSQGYRYATCSRLEIGTQIFGEDITDLIVKNVDETFPLQLDDNIFKNLGLHHVSAIKFTNCSIDEIRPKAFHGLKSLYSVNFSQNKIKKFDPNIFEDNAKLSLLTFEHNVLEFPEESTKEAFLNSPSVQELDVSYSNIRRVSKYLFSKMPALSYLNIAGNNIEEIDIEAFKNLTDLEELDLSENNLTYIPDDIFTTNPEITTLHIQRNPIKSILGLKIPDLIRLNAGETKMDVIGPSMFNGIPYIANLNLSGNGIKEIHQQAFSKLVELNYLDLSHNQLNWISDTIIKENIELEIFRISHNPNLKMLPDKGFVSAAETFDIFLFDASNCGIETISDNALSTFPVLTQIDLSNNKLEKIRKNVFAQTTKLVDINLANNLITHIDMKSFAQTKDLNRLDLHGNPLTVLPSEIFAYIPKLTWLDISSANLNVVFDGEHPKSMLKHLQFMNISNNNIKKIEKSELEMLDSLSLLSIKNNPLECNNEFSDLMAWLTKNNVRPAKPDAMVYDYEAVMKEKDSENNWEFLTNICKTDYDKFFADPLDVKEIVDVPIDNLDTDDIDDEDDIESDDDDDDEEEDDSEYDSDLDVSIKMQDNKITTDIPMDDDIAVNVKVLEGREWIYSFLDSDTLSHGRYDYLWSILIAVFAAMLLLIMIGMLMLICKRRANRQMRYNSAIIAAMNNQGRTKKDCGLVYQQLTEDIKGPPTPKMNRYAPIKNASVMATNLTYESSPFHHSTIVPEAV